MIRYRYYISVPSGTNKAIAEELGCSANFVSRALRYDSETSPSQMRIRDIAINKYGGKQAKVTLR